MKKSILDAINEALRQPPVVGGQGSASALDGEQLGNKAGDTVAEREEIKKAFDWLTPEKAARLTKPINLDAGSSHEWQPS